MGNPAVLAGVGFTALMVAAGRAVETARADRLIDDPYAAKVVMAAAPNPPFPLAPGEPWPVVPGAPDPTADDLWRVAATYIGLRSRVFDDALSASAAAGIRQIVVLAVGLDARAFRLDWPAGTRVFEIDTPAMLAAKDELFVATARCDRRTVPVDLRDDWPAALVAAGFDADQPSAWLAEGLLPYLPAAAQELLIARIATLAAPGSSIAVEHFAPVMSSTDDTSVLRLTKPWGIDVPALIDADLHERPHPVDRLAADGWRTRTTTAREVAAVHGRSLAMPDETSPIDTEFVTAHRPG